jgi:pimeloyl-ACP methyl ester carboxylesterase
LDFRPTLQEQSRSLIRHQFKTQDDVTLNAVETGNPLGQAISFVHGVSQSWRSWLAQFADPQLRERFRFVPLDLSGHVRGALVDEALALTQTVSQRLIG